MFEGDEVTETPSEGSHLEFVLWPRPSEDAGISGSPRVNVKFDRKAKFSKVYVTNLLVFMVVLYVFHVNALAGSDKAAMCEIQGKHRV